MDDMAPHGVIIQISYEVHELRTDGKYDPAIKDRGMTVVEIRGRDRALCEARLRDFLNDIKKVNNVNQTQKEDYQRRSAQADGGRTEGSGESQVSGSSQRGGALAPLLGMRGAAPSGPRDTPENPDHPKVPGRLPALRRP